MVVKVIKSKVIYHYNLNTNTQVDFDNSRKAQSKKSTAHLNPLRRSLGQLTPSNVLTISGYYDVKGRNVQRLRCNIYIYAKELNIHVETSFSQEKKVLLVRLKRDWPVGVDIIN